jgi:predicted RND superfamily exporter protein
MGIIEKLSGLISRYTGLTLTLFFVLTALAITAIVDPTTGKLRLEIDPSADRLFSENQSAKQFYDRTREIFGSDETLIITLAADDIFTQETLDTIGRITDRISEINAVHHVVSLSNAVDIRSVEDGLDISPFVTALEDGTAGLPEIRARVLGNPLYSGSLVSAQGDTTALIVYFNDISDREYIRGGVHERISGIVTEEQGNNEVFMTGSPYFKFEMIGLLVDDLLWTPPIITVILVIVLAFSFRTVIGVIAPLLTVGMGVIFTLATIAVLGYSLSMISVLVPPLLMILGLSYSVHVTSEYHQLRRNPDSRHPVILLTLRHMTLPVMLTGLTTIAGFIALMANPISAVREFGIFSAIGVIYISVLSVTFTPALLKALDRNPGQMTATGSARKGAGFDHFVNSIAKFDLRHQRAIFVSSAIILLLALAGMSKIHVSTESITNFASDSDVRRGFDVVNEKLGGANHFYIVIEGDHQDTFKGPENLEAVKQLQNWLEAQPEIGGTVSVADYLMLINQAFHDNDPLCHSGEQTIDYPVTVSELQRGTGQNC